jgi:hypothetical protein
LKLDVEVQKEKYIGLCKIVGIVELLTDPTSRQGGRPTTTKTVNVNRDHESQKRLDT